jgi:hypothetical protein
VVGQPSVELAPEGLDALAESDQPQAVVDAVESVLTAVAG